MQSQIQISSCKLQENGTEWKGTSGGCSQLFSLAPFDPCCYDAIRNLTWLILKHHHFFCSSKAAVHPPPPSLSICLSPFLSVCVYFKRRQLVSFIYLFQVWLINHAHGFISQIQCSVSCQWGYCYSLHPFCQLLSLVWNHILCSCCFSELALLLFWGDIWSSSVFYRKLNILVRLVKYIQQNIHKYMPILIHNEITWLNCLIIKYSSSFTAYFIQLMMRCSNDTVLYREI